MEYTLKRKNDANKLCLSCRRQCKQLAAAVVANCPRYYPGPKIKRQEWKQLKLGF